MMLQRREEQSIQLLELGRGSSGTAQTVRSIPGDQILRIRTRGQEHTRNRSWRSRKGHCPEALVATQFDKNSEPFLGQSEDSGRRPQRSRECLLWETNEEELGDFHPRYESPSQRNATANHEDSR